MFMILFTIVLTSIMTSLFGYLVHRSLHLPALGRFNRSHMAHHKLYPINDFLSKEYRDAGKDSTIITFAIASIPMILLPIILGILNIIPILIVLITLFIMILIGILHDRIHNFIHIENHFLNKVPIINKLFVKWIELHKVHHMDYSKNFSIFFFLWDKVFKTYEK